MMKSHDTRSYLLFILIALAVVLVGFVLRPFMVPLLLAVIFAVVLSPVYSFFGAHFGRMKSLAALATIITALIGILLPLLMIGFTAGVQAQQLYVSIVQDGGFARHALERVQSDIGMYAPALRGVIDNLSANADIRVEQILQWIITNSVSAATNVAGLMLDSLLFLVALFYLLRDGVALRRAIMTLSPFTDRDDAMLFGRLALAIDSVIKGNLAVAFVQGVVASAGLALFGVPHAILWGIVAMFAALIPGVGTAFVMVPAIAYAYLSIGTMQAIGLAGWAVLAVGLIDNFLGPKLIGNSMKIHPLFVLFSVIGGVSVFGPSGIFLGPLSVSLLAALVSVYAGREEVA